MSNLAMCPDRQDLERLHLGRLSQEQAAALDEHLLACEHCCQVLHELDSTDPLGETLRALGTGESVIDDRVRAVMARLKEITLPGKAVEETLLHSRDATTDAWDLEKLLDPPQAEGELGRFGGYRVLRVLGAGGMGLVFEAEDPQLRRRVALKVMQRSLAAHEENRQRFLREARATAAIEHAHIVTVHQVGEHNGLPFLAMQLLKGESLQDRVERARVEAGRVQGSGFRVQDSVGNALSGVPGAAEDGLPSPSSKESDGLGRPSSLLPLPEGEGTKAALPLAEVLRIGREIAEALTEAHARNLIHRDIKPGNIWLEGASSWVKLVDFGLAHAAEDVHLTQTGAILGTPAYMSPEQARGEAVDGRSDIYSLGAVLYKLTTGDVPFRGASTMAVLMALATETPRPPIELNPDIPPALNDLILRLLAKKPADRYESASAVAEAIRQIETSRVGIAHHEPGGGQCPPYAQAARIPARRRPRWPLIAAAAAFLLATIVIIVHDKDGKEVFRATVPDGGSLTVNDGDLATRIEPTLPDSSVPPKGEPPPPSRRAGIVEPPPLEEWLKGRTVLTVAQDGSVQFKTIQAALNALKPHQAVMVLDSRIYRETLHVDGLPDDVGLVSQRQATIELTAWPETPNAGGLLLGHTLNLADGFRLSGLRFAAPPPGGRPGTARMVQLTRFSGLVIEDCYFGWTGKHDLAHSAQLLQMDNDGGTGVSPIVLRNCLFDSGAVQWDGEEWSWPGALVVERCFFNRSGLTLGAMQVHDVMFRHNVFLGGSLWVHRLKKIIGALEISNNTALLGGELMFNEAPTSGIKLCNNLMDRDVSLGEEANKLRAEIAKGWRRDHNGYALRSELPKSPTDVTDASGYLSSDPASRDFARIPDGSALARGGAGGEFPAYIGALPPGPAPKEGDSFTRLRERWTTVGWALPTIEPKVGNARPTIPEPPPLEEWLKGRTVLTVAQDGSGQFKTIQEAINALKPHQVVKLLDRGPYRELLRTGGLPDDTGLVSDQQTVVETLDWPDGGMAHVIGPVETFRLSGIRFVAPARDSWGAMVVWTEPSGLVVEDCCFALTAAQNPTQTIAAVYFAPEIGAPDKSPVLVRNCLFEYASLEITCGVRSHPTFFVEQNYFRKSNVGLGRRLDQAIFRHNVFDGAKECFWIYELSEVNRALEISNNTAATGVSVVQAAPPQGVILRNNITEHDVAFNGEAYKLRAEIAKNWLRDHNAYLRLSLLAKSPTDVTDDPAYLSSEPADKNYLRIPAGGPHAVGGAGGALPSYMGALPPGPAPKEGDWFTRLRERWATGGQASPR